MVLSPPDHALGVAASLRPASAPGRGSCRVPETGAGRAAGREPSRRAASGRGLASVAGGGRTRCAPGAVATGLPLARAAQRSGSAGSPTRNGRGARRPRPLRSPPLSGASRGEEERMAGTDPTERAPRTVVFFPEGAYGPTNNCVGIGDVLRRRGHRVVFVVEESFAGTLEAKGFEEQLMRLGPAPETPEEPGQFWKDFIRDTAPAFRQSTLEQLETFIAPTWQALLDGARYVDERLVEIFDEVAPDVIVEDNVCALPAIPASGRPWVRIAACNPLEVDDPALPPVF